MTFIENKPQIYHEGYFYTLNKHINIINGGSLDFPSKPIFQRIIYSRFVHSPRE